MSEKPHQASQVVVTVGVFSTEADSISVALLGLLKLSEAVLNYTKIHPSCSKVRSAQLNKEKQNNQQEDLKTG